MPRLFSFSIFGLLVKTLLHFLEGAPKTALTAIHQRVVGKKGLLSSSKVLQECMDAILQPERMLDFMESLEPWQLHVMQWIYCSLERGITHSELVASVPRDEQTQLGSFLMGVSEKLILCRTSVQGSVSYFGFQEFETHFSLPLMSATAPTTTRWHHHGNQLSWHLIRFCSLILRGQVKLTSAGELHRRSQTYLDDSLVSTLVISESAPADERILILQYLSDHGWLKSQDCDVHLSETAWEGLTMHPGRLRHHLCNWWIERRFGLHSSDFRKRLANWPDVIDLGSLAWQLWPLCPHLRIPSLTSASHAWGSLPRILRELWLLGIIEVNLEKGRHSYARLSTEGRHWVDHSSWVYELSALPTPTATANFESILSTISPTKHLFTAACIAEPLSDESFVRIQFAKEPLLGALRAGLSEAWLQDFIAWVRLPPAVAAAIAEWTSIHADSSISNVTLLRILNVERWKELSLFPQFLEHTTESIPQYGFILKPGRNAPVRELLSHFGLEPPLESAPRSGVLLSQVPWSREFAPAVPLHGTPDYEWQPVEARSALANALVGQGKYTTDFQVRDHGETLKVLRYAMVMEVPIEAILKDPILPKAPPRTETFIVVRINNRREPYRISCQKPQGEAFEITMDQIQKIRLTTM